jgi:hypothetical protein
MQSKTGVITTARSATMMTGRPNRDTNRDNGSPNPPSKDLHANALHIHSIQKHGKPVRISPVAFRVVSPSDVQQHQATCFGNAFPRNSNQSFKVIIGFQANAFRFPNLREDHRMADTRLIIENSEALP